MRIDELEGKNEDQSSGRVECVVCFFEISFRAKTSAKLAQYQSFPSLLHYVVLKLCFWLKLLRIPVLPQSLDIEPVNYCNFRCPHCQVTHWDKSHKRLTEAEFQQVVAQVPSLTDIKLQGMGEPLLNREFLPMLEDGLERGIRMQFTTNGSVMNEKIRQRLSAASAARITFSIDGATAESFRSIRVGGDLATIADNIAALAAARNAPGMPHLAIWTVVTQENMAELAEIVSFVAGLGVDEMTIQPLLSSWGKDELEALNGRKRVALDSAALQSTLIEAQTVAEEVGLALSIYRTTRLSRRNKCSWPWQSAYIDSAGNVVPCCILADSDTVTMGNVFSTPFPDIWNGSAYRDLRNRIRSHDLPDYCKGCYQDIES